VGLQRYGCNRLIAERKDILLKRHCGRLINVNFIVFGEA